MSTSKVQVQKIHILAVGFWCLNQYGTRWDEIRSSSQTQTRMIMQLSLWGLGLWATDLGGSGEDSVPSALSEGKGSYHRSHVGMGCPEFGVP